MIEKRLVIVINVINVNVAKTVGALMMVDDIWVPVIVVS